jgi:two-component system response regulator FixJ
MERVAPFLSLCLSDKNVSVEGITMADKVKQHIFFVDDEPSVRKVVAKTLSQLGTNVKCFACAEDCLQQLQQRKCDLLITDVKMPGMDGIEFLIEAKKMAPWLPVLVVTGYGDIPMAVRALKAGAVNFIEKPLDREMFISTIQSALKRTASPEKVLGKALTKTENRILRLILDGKNNREIASAMHRSIRTIEVHRNHIMHKIGADNLVDLIRRMAAMGLMEPLSKK